MTITASGNSIIITGQPRDRDLFQHSLASMSSLRTDRLLDEIIYVVWRGELDGQPETRSALSKLDVHLIETDCALVGGIGNVWHQMKAQQTAVDAVPVDRLVLKTRPDVDLSETLMQRLFSGEIDLSLPQLPSMMPQVVKARLWVPWFEISKPFYMADECFCGLREDVMRLANFDARFDVLWAVDTARSHMRRFSHPFLPVCPFFERYLADYGLSYQSDPIGLTLLQHRLTSPVYATFLAAWYRILNNYFRVAGNIADAPVKFRAWLPPQVEIPDDAFSACFDPARYSWHPEKLRRIYAYDHRWISAICERRIDAEKDPALQLIYEAFDRFDEEGYGALSFDPGIIENDKAIEKHLIAQVPGIDSVAKAKPGLSYRLKQALRCLFLENGDAR